MGDAIGSIRPLGSGPYEPPLDDGHTGSGAARPIGQPIPHSTLFEKQGANDVDAIDPHDPQQGAIGDCDILAALGALANTPQGRAVIRGAIAENRDANGVLVSWTVTLHEPEQHFLGATTFKDVRVVVDAQALTGYAMPRPEGNGTSGSEVWPRVMERAFAIHAGGYGAIGQGGDPADTMTLLTGREATSVPLNGFRSLLHPYSPATLLRDVMSGKPVVLTTPVGRRETPVDADGRFVDPGAHGLIAGHCYSVSGITNSNGVPSLRLVNPWGNEQPKDVPVAELHRWFRNAAIGSLP
jgi:hypothetical protein